MRATQAIIHLGNLASNLSELRRVAGPKPRICLPVKANAYGHGAVAVAKRALEWGVSFLAVATVEEGEELRSAGVGAPILLFSIPSKDEIEPLVKSRLAPFVSDSAFALELEKTCAKAGARLNVHIKVETGMQRTGCPPLEAAGLARLIAGCPHLFLEGMATHLAAADSSLEEDRAFTANQLALFNEAVSAVRAAGINPGILHAANSAATIACPEARLDMVRAGIAAYGYAPSREYKDELDLKPVMELRTEVAYVKKIPAGDSVSYGREWIAPCDCAIATLPIGYADGIRRSLSPGLCVEILGEPCPVRGRVCMDQLMVELPPSIAGKVKPGAPATLFGPAPCLYTAADLAELAGTIPYEIISCISGRVRRVFRD